MITGRDCASTNEPNDTHVTVVGRRNKGKGQDMVVTLDLEDQHTQTACIECLQVSLVEGLRVGVKVRSSG